MGFGSSRDRTLDRTLRDQGFTIVVFKVAKHRRLSSPNCVFLLSSAHRGFGFVFRMFDRQGIHLGRRKVRLSGDDTSSWWRSVRSSGRSTFFCDTHRWKRRLWRCSKRHIWRQLMRLMVEMLMPMHLPCPEQNLPFSFAHDHF